MTTKTTTASTTTATPPTPTGKLPACDVDHPALAGFLAAVDDEALDGLAIRYRRAVQDRLDVEAVHRDAARRLDTLDLALGEAAATELDHLTTQRAIAAATALALAPALAGAQRRETAARVAWLARLRDLATQQAQAAFAEVDAAAEASRSDRLVLMRADGDGHVRQAMGGAYATLREQVITAAKASEPARTRGETCRQIAGIASYFLDLIDEQRQYRERNRRG